MQAKREQALVGLFVIAAAALLFAAVFAMSGAFGKPMKTFHAYFPFAGGIEPGATVRYAGGPKVGRVERVRLDTQDPTLVDVTFSVLSDLPVRTDSSVKIMSLSPLGENHVELLPGNDQAPQAANGALLPSQKYIDFNFLTAQLTELNPQVEGLMHTLNDRATEVKETIQRVNDLLSPQNRANLSATLADTRGLVEDVRPQMNTALHNVNTISDKVQPLIEDFRKTSAEADKALSGINSMVGENQSDVHQAVLELRRALSNMTQATAQLNQTLNANSDNIDEMLDNMRHVTENMKEFTSTIKTRPYTLIRASNPREHKTGEQQ